MKKAFFAVLTILLAMLAVTCDNSISPGVETEKPQFTAGGQPLVSLTIGVPALSRALTQDLAKGGVDYYEVAFKDAAGKVYRASWDYTKAGRIAIPPGDYTGADNAVLFAGRYSDRTLLAVGILTNVDNAGTPPAQMVIEPNTASVTFGLAALTNDVSTDKVNSTFSITGPDSPFDYRTSQISAATIPEALIDGASYPVFRIPADMASGITATYKLIVPNSTGVMIAGAGRILSSGYFYESDSGVTVKGTISPASGLVSDVSGVFNIAIDTAGIGSGLSRFSIDVPVCAIDASSAPGTWYIRGGISNQLLDAGKNVNSLGGAVLLAVGPVNVNGIIIEPNWP